MSRCAGLVLAHPALVGAWLSAHQRTDLRINAARLNGWLADLSRFGATPTGTSRLAYSDADRDAREWVMGLMREARLEVRLDAAANILGRRAGREAWLPPIMFGSHIDSVPDGGNYDGDVGSMGAIEVARTLAEAGMTMRHPIEVVIFQNEEGGLYGSRAMIGELTAQELDLVSRSGKTIREGIRFLGGDPDRLAEAVQRRGDVAAYLELHIEQGATLDEEGVDIGIVEGIVGIRWYEVTIEGFANHAGTTPMNRRHDALLAAAQLVQAVNRVVTSVPGRQVGTVGRIQALPGAPNVIPGRVVLTVEVRDLSAEKIEMLSSQVRVEGERIASATGTTMEWRLINENVPAPTDQRVRRVIAEAARRLGLSSRPLPSGAGHDAQDMARIAPSGMIFVPSVGGISHSPREFTRPEDVANGANVLLHSVLAIDGGA
jgi:N-carbamoyl-L-amino-acid hydrolase